MEYTKVVAKGDFAPGAPNTSIGTIGDAFINAADETIFTSTLTGTDALATDTAAFTDLVTLDRQELQHRSREVFAGLVKYGAISRVSMNDYTLAVGYATLTGTGVTSGDDLRHQHRLHGRVRQRRAPDHARLRELGWRFYLF